MRGDMLSCYSFILLFSKLFEYWGVFKFFLICISLSFIGNEITKIPTKNSNFLSQYLWILNSRWKTTSVHKFYSYYLFYNIGASLKSLSVLLQKRIKDSYYLGWIVVPTYFRKVAEKSFIEALNKTYWKILFWWRGIKKFANKNFFNW